MVSEQYGLWAAAAMRVLYDVLQPMGGLWEIITRTAAKKQGAMTFGSARSHKQENDDPKRIFKITFVKRKVESL